MTGETGSLMIMASIVLSVWQAAAFIAALIQSVIAPASDRGPVSL
jgi:hypothetical protein